jgi:hypothetical protein
MPDPVVSYEALAGKAEQAGKAFEPAPLFAALQPEALEVRFARPSQFRYPISPDEFKALKDIAGTSKASIKPMDRSLMDRAATPAGPMQAMQAAPAAPHFTPGFAGIAATGWLPYDCALAVGQAHIMCAVNSSVAVFHRNGVQAFQKTLSAWFQSVLSAPATVFDPRLTYDSVAGRYILVAAANDNPNLKSWFLVSVSQSSDPTGSWWNYVLDATVDGVTGTSNWADYPGLGQDASAIYLTANMFQWGGQFQYSKLRIVPKASLYAGASPTYTDFVGMTNGDGSLVFTLQPSNVLDPAGIEKLINTIYPTPSRPSSTGVTVWTVQNPVNNPTLQQQLVACSAYAIPPHADQPGGAPPVDTGDVRVMNAVVRDGFLWAAFVTQQNWQDDPSNVAAVFWVQIDMNQGLVQEGIFGASSMHYYYPAIQPLDKQDCTLAFSRSGLKDFASLCAATRKAADAAGTFGPSAMIGAGLSGYTGLDGSGRNRWGDYTAVAPDPAAPDTGWVYGGYASRAAQWATWVASGTA